MLRLYLILLVIAASSTRLSFSSGGQTISITGSNSFNYYLECVNEGGK